MVVLAGHTFYNDRRIGNVDLSFVFLVGKKDRKCNACPLLQTMVNCGQLWIESITERDVVKSGYSDSAGDADVL